VLHLLQHSTLVVGVLDLLHLDHLGLLQHLDGIEALVVLGLHEMHSSKAASAQGSLDLEVGEGVFALCGPGQDRRWLRLLLIGDHGAIDGLAVVRLVRLVRGLSGGRVYEVLYARDIVGCLLVGFGRSLRGRIRLLRIGIHGVGLLGLRGRRRRLGGLGRKVRLR
jgi:hypothetical protein